MKTILVHGVPDTPAMWQPLIDALGSDISADLSAPALPGFMSPVPPGFDCTKEAYVDWLISQIEAAGEPVNLVGHDWGALLVVRAASLRPDLVRSWAVANALPERSYKWHQTARIWQTPLLGEMFMALTGKDRLARSLASAGMPEALARHEADHWSPHMRKAILQLYRSAKNIAEEWTGDLHKLPGRGLVFWGDDDPFVPVEAAERFCAETNTPLHRNASTGHWSVVEKAPEFAALLQAHWKS
ncbi:alpha/beta fold hydrolase [Henriciella algicola]|uniref:Alpha/beta fold hydrolase n=1 Tax=Henriciella algicola TaxID=1608422 RepID=A0A399RUY4_9PROT|nr:alpha/beta fold hydrolase [Henriciella algicola]RIJ33255.1 alpha/beta fold hydrolase [Henriciella algicola]